MDLFLSILEEKDCKSLLFETPPDINSIGLDVDKLRDFFQHEQEYENLKMQNLEYERGLLELNEKLSIKTIEFNRKIAELEGTIIQKNEEMNVLTENIQNTINMNIELERETQKLGDQAQEKMEKIKSLEDQLKHYEDSLLVKNEEFMKNIEKCNLIEEEKHVLQNKIDDLQEENSNLKEKDFRNQILQDQNEEIMRSVKGILLKSSKDLAKGLENVDIKEDLKRLESETTSDFSLFIQEVERFFSSVNTIFSEQFKGQVENIR